MTHDSVTSFAASLVEMAQSHQKVPLLEDHIRNLEAALSERADQVQKLELRIIDLKTDQDSLYAKLRAVEVERDDASFRLLESEDRVAVVKHLLGGAQVALGDAVRAVTPEPVVEVPKAPLSDTTNTQSESSSLPQGVPAYTGSIELHAESGEHSTAPSSAYAPDGTVSPGEMHPDVRLEGQGQAVTTQDGEFPTGQSEPGPTSSGAYSQTASVLGQEEFSTASVGQAEAGTGEGSIASIADDERIHGPYFGKRYFDHPAYVSLENWKLGGGTEADYHWRPGAEPAFSRASHFS